MIVIIITIWKIKVIITGQGQGQGQGQVINYFIKSLFLFSVIKCKLLIEGIILLSAVVHLRSYVVRSSARWSCKNPTSQHVGIFTNFSIQKEVAHHCWSKAHLSPRSNPQKESLYWRSCSRSVQMDEHLWEFAGHIYLILEIPWGKPIPKVWGTFQHEIFDAVNRTHVGMEFGKL